MRVEKYFVGEKWGKINPPKGKGYLKLVRNTFLAFVRNVVVLFNGNFLHTYLALPQMGNLYQFFTRMKNPKFLNVNTLLVATTRMLPSSPFFNRIMCEQCRQNRLCSTVCHFGFSKYSMRVTMVFFELFELSIVF